MPVKQNKNLNNTKPTSMKGGTWGKKMRHDHWAIFHYRGEIKVIGKETDTQKCKECNKILNLMAFTTGGLRGDGAYYLQQTCRQCATILRQERRTIRKNAPPRAEHCNNCHRKDGVNKFTRLQADHVHGSSIFRGWLCADCNTGMGKLGDSLEAILQAAIYLENDTDKIIETLHKISNKMFARTQ